ncbi:hypothetical protein FN846DRAFT_901796 [Sphaerosporella brunnea]|uniref:Uncharacterized protein n=1 Tax=Sphaerosporella brunnea TaxID=1250544 RepID=A0A5J5FAS6_9PEZI|nr:hypothetical protein FN846DRAFT_901796 [Sphaerosporella brunnea]
MPRPHAPDCRWHYCHRKRQRRDRSPASAARQRRDRSPPASTTTQDDHVEAAKAWNAFHAQRDYRKKRPGNLGTDMRSSGYVPQNDANFTTVCPICHHKFGGGQQGLARLRQPLSQTVPEFLGRLGGGPTCQTCIPNLDAQNLIRVLLHCDRGFRAPNNLPTGGVDMVALNEVPRVWWRFFGTQWSETGKMFTVRIALNIDPYPQRPGSVAQWMAAVESI